jgi:ABC-type transport system substrate-binding protein
MRNPHLLDRNVRKALMHALDREKLAQSLWFDYGKAADSFLSPQDPNYKPGPGSLKYDLNQADQLLKDSGWMSDAAGKRTKNGQFLTVSIMTLSDPQRLKIAQFVQQSWQKIGIVVEIVEVLDRAEFFSNVHKARFKDSALFSWSSAPDVIPWTIFHSSQIPSSKNNYHGGNVGGWFNKDVDDLLKELLTIYDVAEKKEKYEAIGREFEADLPVLPLFFKPVVVAVAPEIDGFLVSGHLFQSSLYFQSWEIK